jgi:long-chain acyl-CoA synthetase
LRDAHPTSVSDPLALLPLALAAGGGHVDRYETQQLVAAGLTLLQRSAPLVRALSGKRSAILLPTSPHFFVALAASDGRGAVLINPLAAPAEVAFQCADANVGAIFTTSAFVPRLPAGMPYVLLDDAPRTASVHAGGVARAVDLGSHHGLSLEGEPGVAGRDEEAVIVYTSAMRGTPLGAVLTHRNLLANARSTIEALGNRSDDQVLALLPLAHLFGLTVTASAPLLLGARVTTMERFHPVKAADLLMEGITEVVGVPAVFHAMLSGIARRGVDLRESALRLCICGGAELPVELQDRWFDATGVELRQGYGLTEAAPVTLVNYAGRPNVRGSLGHALPGVEVEIHQPADYSSAISSSPPSTIPVPDGQPGEISVRGENVFAGYVRNDGAGLPRREGWLATGDIGVRDVDGTIRFLGLLKPMFTRSGFNVYPRELERVVSGLAGVSRVEVVPIPEPTKENDILMRVWGSVSEDEVRRWCESRLSAYKQPSVVEVVTE